MLSTRVNLLPKTILDVYDPVCLYYTLNAKHFLIIQFVVFIYDTYKKLNFFSECHIHIILFIILSHVWYGLSFYHMNLMIHLTRNSVIRDSLKMSPKWKLYFIKKKNFFFGFLSGLATTLVLILFIQRYILRYPLWS